MEHSSVLPCAVDEAIDPPWEPLASACRVTNDLAAAIEVNVGSSDTWEVMYPTATRRCNRLASEVTISSFGIIFYFCLSKTQEDIKNNIFIKVLRGV